MHRANGSWGFDREDIIASINAKGRDNARTPMQWDDTPNGGFTTGTPWLRVNSNYASINAAAALADSNSIFHTYKQLIALRKANPIIVWGDYELIEEGPEQLFLYLRRYEGRTWAVAANFGGAAISASVPWLGHSEAIIIANYERTLVDFAQLDLQPFEAFAVELAQVN
ncbi:DUF3459 domain-containing protein [Cohnella sp. LGH]|uniref:alpha-amylase family glycosyl hydrolase n=1 Tax=Cohnella sp. LGH TaxID=1619153 RepID=UPI001ADAA8A5|nr:DUF3459 domain-containing protein [Cohnella sp. LGH]QTH41848.1 DUF3459 domain-containing protein [Cohnella sp. LGH]